MINYLLKTIGPLLIVLVSVFSIACSSGGGGGGEGGPRGGGELTGTGFYGTTARGAPIGLGGSAIHYQIG